MDQKEKRQSYQKDHRQRLRKRYSAMAHTDGFSDIEVLELFLCYAIPRKDVKPIAYELVRRFGSLENIFSATKEELCQVDGLGESSAMLFTLFFDLNKRISVGKSGKNPILFDIDTAGKYGIALLKREKNEHFYALLLDSQHRLIHAYLASTGTPSQTAIHPRDIVSMAINIGASNVILLHNHPGQTLMPSTADIELTKRIEEALRHVGIQCLEHLIVTNDSYYAIKSKQEYEPNSVTTTSAVSSSDQHIDVLQPPQTPADLKYLANVLCSLSEAELSIMNSYIADAEEDE